MSTLTATQQVNRSSTSPVSEHFVARQQFYWRLLWPTLAVLIVVTLLPTLYLIITSFTPLDLTRPETAWNFAKPLGNYGLLRIHAARREQCNDCMDCFKVCPEPQILKPVLKGSGTSTLIDTGACNNCGRCIDVCTKDVFVFGTRFSNKTTNKFAQRMEVTS